MKVPFSGTLLSVSLFTASFVPNQVVILTGSSITINAYGCGTAGTCGVTAAGQSMSVVDVESLTGLSTNGFATVNLVNSVTVTNGQFVAIIFMLTTSGTSPILFCACAASAGQSSVGDTQFNFGTTNPSGAFSTVTGPLALVVGGSFQATTSSGSTITQCYGNCGSPAVTLANTNSTHGINWNASLTLFYEFQSNLNGFVTNVTFSLAKNIQNPQVVAVGIYTIPSCTSGFTPFSQSCPGSLVQSGNTGVSASKGKFSLTLNQGAVTVSNGQWIGIALSATIAACCDVNDTNTAVQIFQTVGGVPAIITSSTNFNAAFKMGLWTFITGQTVGAPPTGAGSACVSNFAQIDCLLPALVNDFCNVQTTACITTSALVWTPILAIIFLVITLAAFSTFSPGVQISFREAENVFLIFLLIVVFMMTDQGLLPIWVDLFFFMVVAVMFGKQVQGKLA